MNTNNADTSINAKTNKECAAANPGSAELRGLSVFKNHVAPQKTKKTSNTKHTENTDNTNNTKNTKPRTGCLQMR